MTIIDTVKGTVGTAVDTISTVAQAIVEKNRTNAKLNRLRMVMKSESELMNRAYIALGKSYYDGEKKGTSISDTEREKLFSVIEKSKAKIAKARECYRKIVDSHNDIFYGTSEIPEYNASEIVDITVACSNESEYKSSPFESTAPLAEIDDADIVDSVDITEENESTAPISNAAETAEPAKDKLNDLKEELESKKNTDEKFFSADEADEADDTESPEDELF